MSTLPDPIRIGNFYPPQVLNKEKNAWEILTGSDGAYKAQTIQTVVADFFSGTTSMTKVLDEDMNGVSIFNNGSEIMTFTIDGVTRPVFAGGTYQSIFKQPFREISIMATGEFYIDLLQQLGAAATVIVPEPPDTTAPDNVTNLAYSGVTQNSVTLNWSASIAPDTAGYEVWQGGSLITTVTATTFSAAGLSPSTQYTYTIKAKDATGNVASGTSINVTTEAQPSDTTPPANVTGLTSSNVTQTGVTLSWQVSASSDVKDYRIYNGATLLATVTALTYAVSGLTASTTYTLTVKARDTSNNEASGTSVNVTTAAPADTTPPVLTITPAGGSFTSTQSVAMSTNETAEIYYTLNGVDPTETDAKYTTALSVSATTTLKARARDMAGNWSTVQTVVYTITVPDTTPPDPISGLTAGTPTLSSVPVTFTPSPSGDVVAVEAAYSTDGSTFTVASTSITPSAITYTFAGLAATTAYTFRLVAIDGAGNRSTAVTVQATTAVAAPPPSHVTSGLQIYYDFKSLITTPTTVPDSSGIGFDGTMHGYAGTAASGINNGELVGDGTGDYIVIPNHAALKAYPFTAEFYIKAHNRAASPPNSVRLLDWGQYGTAGTSGGVNVYLNNAANTTPNVIGLAGTTGSPAMITHPIALFDDVYRHIVIVFGSNFQKIYIDGILVKEQTGSTSSTLGTRDIYLFAAGNSLADTLTHGCKLFRLYNRELSLAEIAQNKNSAVGG